MAKKNKNSNREISKKEISEANNKLEEKDAKEGYRIILKTKTFIIIDKYGINVKIKLSMQELVKYQIGDLYYL